MSDVLASAAIDEERSFEGIVSGRRAIATTGGVRATITVPEGGEVVCVWWDGSVAPADGSVVAVTGHVKAFRGRNELHVDRTIITTDRKASDRRDHRLLQYWFDCLEAEAIASLVLPATGAGHLLLSTGAEPALSVSGPTSLPTTDASVNDWCTQRQMAGAAEIAYAGWPLVTAFRALDDGGSVQRVVAPLFFAPIKVAGERRRGWTVEATSPPEVNSYALMLLGISRDERDELADALELLGGANTGAAWAATRLQFLGDNEVLPATAQFDPTRLEPPTVPSRSDSSVSNTAVLFVARGVGFTRNLLRELNELANVPEDQLREGPLGALLGHVSPAAPPGPQPQPSILPTTLAQDQAITSALSNVLTVVTGPPGTGKSQVLVNAIAAAVERGESVLFASKNNKAVDVVFERLRAASLTGVPIRAGRAELRGEVCAAIERALEEAHGDPPDVATADSAWREWAATVMSVYQRANDAVRARAALTEAERQAEQARAHVPLELHSAVDEADAEMVEASLNAAIDAARHCERKWWFWRRRRRREAERSAAEKLETLLKWIPEDHPLAATPPDAVFAGFTSVLTALSARDMAAEARRVVESMPSWSELDEQLHQLSTDREVLGVHLFDAKWSHSLQYSSKRGTAAAYARALAKVAGADGKGAGRLLAHVTDVLAVFPVWGVTNLSARTFLPLERDLFDLVVIDEASQCDLPSAVPLLWRAKRAMVIGDPNQLTHITRLKPERDVLLSERHGLDAETFDHFSYSAHSLFAAADAACPSSVFLDRHYRSHPDIIGFPNEHVYGDRLRVMRASGASEDGAAVQWRHIAGLHRKGTRGASSINEPEARLVVELAADLVPLSGGSLGIVTPFRAQVELIRRLLGQRLPDLFQEVLVETAHGFQGDERDVIVFSPVVSDEMPGGTIAWASDRHLVNVALTRARQRLFIVGDHDACVTAPGLIGKLAFWCDARGFVKR